MRSFKICFIFYVSHVGRFLPPALSCPTFNSEHMDNTLPAPDEIRFMDTLLGVPLNFTTTWGLFSPEKIDAGSRLLLEYLDLEEIPAQANIFDLGCGYGALGLPLAARFLQSTVTMVDTDFVAVEYAGLNARSNKLSNVSVQLSNGFRHIAPDVRFDLIISNLPAKVGRELTHRFFEDAHERLVPGGKIVAVTVLGLKEFVKRSFKETFGTYKKLKQGNTHVVAQAVRT